MGWDGCEHCTRAHLRLPTPTSNHFPSLHLTLNSSRGTAFFHASPTVTGCWRIGAKARSIKRRLSFTNLVIAGGKVLATAGKHEMGNQIVSSRDLLGMRQLGDSSGQTTGTMAWFALDFKTSKSSRATLLLSVTLKIERNIAFGQDVWTNGDCALSKDKGCGIDWSLNPYCIVSRFPARLMSSSRNLARYVCTDSTSSLK